MTAAGRGDSSTTPRLSRGDIPVSWTQPAESMSIVPEAAARSVAPVFIVAGGIIACVALGMAWAPRTDGSIPAVTPAPPQAAGSATPRPIEDVPEPPLTGSSVPTGVAPEDQGGADHPIEAVAPIEAAPVETVVSELPARKKARDFVARGEKLLLAGNAKAAEPFLRRAAALDPTLPEAWRALGIVRATLNDGAGARTAYKRYLKLQPDAPDAADVRRILAGAPPG